MNEFFGITRVVVVDQHAEIQEIVYTKTRNTDDREIYKNEKYKNKKLKTRNTKKQEILYKLRNFLQQERGGREGQCRYCRERRFTNMLIYAYIVIRLLRSYCSDSKYSRV